MSLKAQGLSGQKLQWLNASIPQGTLGNATRILFQDGMAIIVPDRHIVRRCFVASNNVVGAPTIQLVRWADGGDEANPIAVSDIVIMPNSAGGADVRIKELTFPSTKKEYLTGPQVYGLRAVGDAGGDLLDDVALLIGVEFLERR